MGEKKKPEGKIEQKIKQLKKSKAGIILLVLVICLKVLSIVFASNTVMEQETLTGITEKDFVKSNTGKYHINIDGKSIEVSKKLVNKYEYDSTENYTMVYYYNPLSEKYSFINEGEMYDITIENGLLFEEYTAEVPSTELFINSIQVEFLRGAYQWSYYNDKGDKEVIMTDSESPAEVTFSKPIDFNVKTDTFNLYHSHNNEPYDTDIFVWDEYKELSAYKSLNEIKETGVYNIEFVFYYLGENQISYVTQFNFAK